MTPQAIADLRVLVGRATPGPWGLDTALELDGACLTRAIMTAKSFIANVLLDDEDDAEAEANAALIVALVNAAPALLNTAERVGRLEEALRRFKDAVDSGYPVSHRLLADCDVLLTTNIHNAAQSGGG